MLIYAIIQSISVKLDYTGLLSILFFAVRRCFKTFYYRGGSKNLLRLIKKQALRPLLKRAINHVPNIYTYIAATKIKEKFLLRACTTLSKLYSSKILLNNIYVKLIFNKKVNIFYLNHSLCCCILIRQNIFILNR
jgi:hypothetical protein